MIQRERTVELFMEGQHYFDIRRWMICGEGEEADQSVLYSMNMNGKINRSEPTIRSSTALFLKTVPGDVPCTFIRFHRMKYKKVGFWFRILYGKN